MFALAILGIVQGVYALNDSVVNSVCLIDDAYLRFNAFLDNVKIPLEQLNIDFAVSVSDLQDAAVQDPQLSENVRSIGLSFKEVKSCALFNKEQVQDGTNPIEVKIKEVCDTVWDELATQCDEAKAKILVDANKIDQSLIDVQEQIQTSVIDASADATVALSEGSVTIQDTQDQLGKMIDPRAYNLMTYSALIRQNRDVSGLGAYGWVFFIIILSFVSIGGMKIFRTSKRYLNEGDHRNNPNMEGRVVQLWGCCGHCFACIGCCSWFQVLSFGILCSFLALIFLPVAAVGDDLCLVLPTLPQKMGELTKSPEISQITGTCWNKTGNLFNGLGLDQAIDLNGINFDEFKEKFGSGSGVDIDKTAVSQLRTTVNDIDMSCYSDNSLYKNATLFAVDSITRNITFAENAFNTNPSVKKLTTSGEKLINRVKCAIQDFVRGTSCYFIAETWEDAMNVLCVEMFGAIGWIGMTQLLLAVLAIPYTITMLCIMKRMGGHGPLKASAEEDEEDGEEDEDEDKDDDRKVEMSSRRRRGQQESEYTYVVPFGGDGENYDDEDEEEDELDVEEILSWSKSAGGDKKSRKKSLRGSQYLL